MRSDHSRTRLNKPTGEVRESTPGMRARLCDEKGKWVRVNPSLPSSNQCGLLIAPDPGEDILESPGQDARPLLRPHDRERLAGVGHAIGEQEAWGVGIARVEREGWSVRSETRLGRHHVRATVARQDMQVATERRTPRSCSNTASCPELCGLLRTSLPNPSSRPDPNPHTAAAHVEGVDQRLGGQLVDLFLCALWPEDTVESVLLDLPRVGEADVQRCVGNRSQTRRERRCPGLEASLHKSSSAPSGD